MRSSPVSAIRLEAAASIPDIIMSACRFTLRLLARLSASALRALIGFVPWGLGIINSIDNFSRFLFKASDPADTETKDFIQLFVSALLFMFSISSILFIRLMPIFNVVIAALMLINKAIDTIVDIHDHKKPSRKFPLHIHDMIIATLMLVGSCIILSPIPVIGEIILLVLAAYMLLDAIGLNPVKLIPCFKKPNPSKPEESIKTDSRFSKLKAAKSPTPAVPKPPAPANDKPIRLNGASRCGLFKRGMFDRHEASNAKHFESGKTPILTTLSFRLRSVCR